MTEEDIHINGKRVAMTERMMEEVLINELDNMLQITRVWPKPLTEMTLVKLSY